MRLFLFFLLVTASAALGGESAVLTSGTRMHVDRHETDGSRVRLYNTSGFIEIEASLVRSFEADEVAPASVAPPAISSEVPVAPTPPSRTPREMADAAADRYGLPRSLVRSVMAAESGFQPRAVSPKGAIGLMQLMPGTAQTLGIDPQDPAQNVDGGTRYLRDLLLQYNGQLWHALAAYNAGPGAVDKSPDGLPPYRETLQYVNRIDKAFRQAAN